MQCTFFQKPVAICLLFFIAIILSGCNSVPKPVGELASAKAQIETAETNGAVNFAPVEFDRAKTKLREAEVAAAKDNNEIAKRLADESLSDAKLANAKASAARAKQSAQKMKDTVNTLGNELERVQKY